MPSTAASNALVMSLRVLLPIDSIVGRRGVAPSCEPPGNRADHCGATDASTWVAVGLSIRCFSASASHALCVNSATAAAREPGGALSIAVFVCAIVFARFNAPSVPPTPPLRAPAAPAGPSPSSRALLTLLLCVCVLGYCE